MTQQPAFRSSANSVRRDARAKLKELRRERFAKKQNLGDSSCTSLDTLAVNIRTESASPSAVEIGETIDEAVPFSRNAGAPIAHEAPYAASVEDGLVHAFEKQSRTRTPIDEFTTWSGNTDNSIDEAESVALAEIDFLERGAKPVLESLSEAVERVGEEEKLPYCPDEDLSDCSISSTSKADQAVEYSEKTPDPIESSGKPSLVIPENQHGERNDPSSSDRTNSCKFRSHRAIKTEMQESLYVECKDLQGADITLQEEMSLTQLPGIGPGLIWMLEGCGIQSLSDLALTSKEKLKVDLGLVGQILDLEPWIEFAKLKTDVVAPNCSTAQTG